jgi:predicted MFS family arabinose efflux permease
VFALLAVRFVDEFAGFLPTGTFESFRDDLGLTYTQASAVLTIAAPGAIVGNVFAVLADYRSRRVIASCGAVGFAAALAGFGFAHSFLALLTASFAYGMASTAMVDATEVALVDVAGDETSAQISRAHLFGAAGDLLGPVLLIGTAATGLSWRVALGIGAGVAAVYAMWLACCPLPPPARRHAGHRARDGLRPIVRNPEVWYLGVLALMLGPMDEHALAFLIAYLEHDFGLSTAAATSVALASVAGSVVGFLTTSRRGYRPAEHALRNHAGLLALTTFASVAAHSLVVVVVAEFVFGIAIARYFIALKTRIVALYPDRVGSMNAVISTIEFSGFVLPLVAGRIADTFGVRAGFGFSALIACATLVLVVFGDRRARAAGAQASRERAI